MDYIQHWTERAELPAKRLLGWMELGTSKFYQGRSRYGKVEEHNGKIPRDWWLAVRPLDGPDPRADQSL